MSEAVAGKGGKGRGGNGRFVPKAVPVVAEAVTEPVAAADVAAPVEAAVEAVAKAAAPAVPVVETAAATMIEETQAAPVVAPAATKEVSTMVEQLKASAQTAFTQATDKARETLDKTVKSFEDAGEFAKGNVEALVASGKAATAGFETLAQGAVDYSKKSFEDGTAVLKTITTTRSPVDALKIQNDFAKSQFDGLGAEMSRSTEVMMKIMGDVFEPLSSRFALAAEKAKSAVAVAR